MSKFLRFATAAGALIGGGLAAGWSMADENNPKVKKTRQFVTDNAPMLMLASMAVGTLATTFLLDRKILPLPILKPAKETILAALEAGQNVYIQLTPENGWFYAIGETQLLENVTEMVKEA